MEIQNTSHSDNIVNRTRHDTSVVTGLFRDRDSAERAYRAVTSRGYSNDEVNVIMSDDAAVRWVPSLPRPPRSALRG